MPAVHRHSDPRTCGATTVVTGQSTVFSEGLLWAVQGDLDTHGEGALIPSGSNVFVEDKLVIVNSPDSASPDSLCIPLGGEHCNPKTAGGSGTVSAY
jgi:hypothetical protein